MSDNDALERDDRREALSLASQMIRWALSSLLLVNGGALLGILGAVDHLPATALLSSREFATGLIIALYAGAMMGMSATFAAARHYYSLRDKQSLAAMAFSAQVLMGTVTLGAAGYSATCFSIGVVQVADAVEHAANTKTTAPPSSHHNP